MIHLALIGGVLLLAVGGAVAFADRIREEIRETLGFTVNVGVSDRRFLAKMASDFTKGVMS